MPRAITEQNIIGLCHRQLHAAKNNLASRRKKDFADSRSHEATN
jgi:hypothetical protein